MNNIEFKSIVFLDFWIKADKLFQNFFGILLCFIQQTVFDSTGFHGFLCCRIKADLVVHGDGVENI